MERALAQSQHEYHRSDIYQELHRLRQQRVAMERSQRLLSSSAALSSVLSRKADLERNRALSHRRNIELRTSAQQAALQFPVPAEPAAARVEQAKSQYICAVAALHQEWQQNGQQQQQKQQEKSYTPARQSGDENSPTAQAQAVSEQQMRQYARLHTTLAKIQHSDWAAWGGTSQVFTSSQRSQTLDKTSSHAPSTSRQPASPPPTSSPADPATARTFLMVNASTAVPEPSRTPAPLSASGGYVTLQDGDVPGLPAGTYEVRPVSPAVSLPDSTLAAPPAPAPEPAQPGAHIPTPSDQPESTARARTTDLQTSNQLDSTARASTTDAGAPFNCPAEADALCLESSLTQLQTDAAPEIAHSPSPRALCTTDLVLQPSHSMPRTGTISIGTPQAQQPAASLAAFTTPAANPNASTQLHSILEATPSCDESAVSDHASPSSARSHDMFCFRPSSADTAPAPAHPVVSSHPPHSHPPHTLAAHAHLLDKEPLSVPGHLAPVSTRAAPLRDSLISSLYAAADAQPPAAAARSGAPGGCESASAAADTGTPWMTGPAYDAGAGAFDYDGTGVFEDGRSEGTWSGPELSGSGNTTGHRGAGHSKVPEFSSVQLTSSLVETTEFAYRDDILASLNRGSRVLDDTSAAEGDPASEASSSSSCDSSVWGAEERATIEREMAQRDAQYLAEVEAARQLRKEQDSEADRVAADVTVQRPGAPPGSPADRYQSHAQSHACSQQAAHSGVPVHSLGTSAAVAALLAEDSAASNDRGSSGGCADSAQQLPCASAGGPSAGEPETGLAAAKSTIAGLMSKVRMFEGDVFDDGDDASQSPRAESPSAVARSPTTPGPVEDDDFDF